MDCATLMKTDIECCQSEDTVEHVARRMAARDIGFVPVCNEDGGVIGTLTDRDIVLRVVAKGRQASNTTVSEVLSLDAICCAASDDLSVAEALMSKHKKSRIICLDERNRMVGVISLSDVARVETGARASALLRSVAQREARP